MKIFRGKNIQFAKVGTICTGTPNRGYIFSMLCSNESRTKGLQVKKTNPTGLQPQYLEASIIQNGSYVKVYVKRGKPRFETDWVTMRFHFSCWLDHPPGYSIGCGIFHEAVGAPDEFRIQQLSHC